MPIRGLERLLRLIYSPDVRARDHFETVMRYEGYLLHINTSSFIEWVTFFKGHYEKNVTDLIRKVVKPHFTVIDVGANVGIHTLSLSRASKKVVAIEPNPIAARRLRQNLVLNRLSNVEILELAVSDSSGVRTLFCPDERYPHQGISSFHQGHSSELTVARTVEVTTVDSIAADLEAVHLIKIDTEGHDLRVMRGSQSTISLQRPVILFEFHERSWRVAGASWEEARAFLEDAGYEIALVGSRGIQPLEASPKEANLVAIPRLHKRSVTLDQATRLESA